MRLLPPVSQRPIARNRRLSSSIPARPYICRFNSFNLLMQPSTRPLLHGYVSAFITASMSCSRLLAKPLSGANEDRAACSSHALSASALLSVRILLNSCRREYASRADGDASRTMSRKRRSFSSSFSGGQVNHRRNRLGPGRMRRTTGLVGVPRCSASAKSLTMVCEDDLTVQLRRVVATFRPTGQDVVAVGVEDARPAAAWLGLRTFGCMEVLAH